MGSRIRWILPAVAIVAVVIVVALIIALRGGDDEGNDAASAGSVVPTQTEDGADGGETAAPTGPGSGAELSELNELNARWRDASAKVTYDFTRSTTGVEAASTLTLWVDPPNSRVDFEDSSTGEATSFIQKGNETFVCTGGQCQRYYGGGVLDPIPRFAGQFADPDGIDSVAGGFAGTNIDTFDEEIAGEAGRCFRGEIEGVEISWCFSEDGLLLLSSTRGPNGVVEIRAAEIDPNISGDDFEPQGPIVDSTLNS